jgi:hypothetical protein
MDLILDFAFLTPDIIGLSEEGIRLIPVCDSTCVTVLVRDCTTHISVKGFDVHLVPIGSS